MPGAGDGRRGALGDHPEGAAEGDDRGHGQVSAAGRRPARASKASTREAADPRRSGASPAVIDL